MEVIRVEVNIPFKIFWCEQDMEGSGETWKHFKEKFLHNEKFRKETIIDNMRDELHDMSNLNDEFFELGKVKYETVQKDIDKENIWD